MTKQVFTKVRTNLHAAINQRRHALLTAKSYLTDSYLTSILSILVVSLALSLPLGLAGILQNLKQFTQPIARSWSVSLFLKDQSEQSAQQVVQALKKHPGIAEFEVIPPQQGLHDLQKYLGFTQLISSLAENPLPTVVVVYPSLSWQSSESIIQLSSDLQRLAQVDLVQLDHQWLARLQAMLDLGNNIFWALFIGFSLILLLIITNLTRQFLQSKAPEIRIMMMLGASQAFLRRPFIYTSIFYGISSVLLANLGVMVFLTLIGKQSQQLLSLYGFQIHVIAFDGNYFVGSLIGTVILSLLATRVGLLKLSSPW